MTRLYRRIEHWLVSFAETLLGGKKQRETLTIYNSLWARQAMADTADSYAAIRDRAFNPDEDDA